MQKIILRDIRANIYLYTAIVAVCLVASIAISFLIGGGSYVGKATISGGDETGTVTITVKTEDKESNSEILNYLTNETISEMHSVLNTNVNKSSTTSKSVNVVVAVIRGLVIGIVVCLITSLNVLIPRKKVKSEDEISEIFDGVPIIAKFSKSSNSEGKNR